MHFGIRMLACLVAGIACSHSSASENISYECNPTRSWVRVGKLQPPEASQRDTKARVSQVNWLSLLKVDEEKLTHEEPTPIGSRVTVRRCGRLSLQFSAGFLHPATGDAPFPVVEIRLGKASLLPPTAFSLCTANLMKYNHFGQCPGSWAESVTAAWNEKSRKVEISVIRDYKLTPESPEPTREVESFLRP
jgi:hypothetical protein